MKRIIIFGTGMAARRAFRYASGQDDFVVIAFADNDVEKQGTDFYKFPVISAEQLSEREDWDFVWVASQWHQEIIDGLIRLGVSESNLIPFESKPDIEQLWRMQSAVNMDALVEVGGRQLKSRELPKVLILSCETLNDSHGTGILLKRYFGAFPASHLFSFHQMESGHYPWLKQSSRITLKGTKGREEIRETLRQESFVPDIIFATALRESDLELLELVLDVFEQRIPVVQFFMDLMPLQQEGFFEKLRNLSPGIDAMWALSEPMQQLLQTNLIREIKHITGLHLRVSKNAERHSARELREGFRTVMIGNFYNPDIVPFIRNFWRQCRAKLPELAPVEWYVDPQRAQTLFEEDLDPGMDFVWRGFFMGELLREKLRSADLALLPFNHGQQASSNYQRYSLPSRISEYAAAGLPVFAFATKDVPLSSFITESGCGRVVSGINMEQSVEAFVEYILNTKARDEASKTGLKLASENFDLDRFRSWFHAFLIDTIRDSKAKTIS